MLAADMWVPFFVLVASMACKILLVCISYSAVQLYTVGKRPILAADMTKVVRVIDTRAYERGVLKEYCSGARQVQRGPRLKEHLSVCY